MSDTEILSFAAAAKRYNRHPNMLRKTWMRAELPVYPTVTQTRDGKVKTVQGIDMRMLEAFLVMGGCPRRVASATLGAEVKKRFGLT